MKRPDKYLLLLPFLTLPFVYNNCAPANFASTESVSQSSVSAGTGDSTTTITKTFSTDVVFSQNSSVPLDLVWVIDNSGSMNEEAAHVRNNFSSFISKLSASADIRLALISKSGSSGTSVSLPVTGSQYLSLNQTVSSTNSALLVAQALCSDSIKNVCQSAGVSTSSSIGGKLAEFLRPESKKAIVFVTDDESSLSASKFEMVASAAYPGQTIAKFGFVGLGSSVSPCQAKTGSVYKQMATSSGGSVFNICENDWTQTFATLTNNVTKLVSQSFPISNEIQASKVISVSVNGMALKASQYSISNGEILIVKEIADLSANGRVVIVYRL